MKNRFYHSQEIEIKSIFHKYCQIKGFQFLYVKNTFYQIRWNWKGWQNYLICVPLSGPRLKQPISTEKWSVFHRLSQAGFSARNWDDEKIVIYTTLKPVKTTIYNIYIYKTPQKFLNKAERNKNLSILSGI